MHCLVHIITAKPIVQVLDRHHWEACLQTWAMHDLAVAEFIFGQAHGCDSIYLSRSATRSHRRSLSSRAEAASKVAKGAGRVLACGSGGSIGLSICSAKRVYL